LPGLAPVAAMGAMDPDSDAYLHLHVRMMRHRNRVAVALSEANRRAEQALIQLEQA
jgi:hypothetical protein